MKKEGMNPNKRERNRMVVECNKGKIKVKRNGRTVKQQMAYLSKALENRKKEEKVVAVPVVVPSAQVK